MAQLEEMEEPVEDLNEEVAVEALIATLKSTDKSDPDDLSELDTLLEESMEQRRFAQEAHKARERVRRGNQSPEEREADLQRIRDWADKHEWEAIATAGVFNRFNCACGNSNTVFDCLMIEERHKTDKFAKRWINLEVERRTTPRVGEPPKVTVVREKQVSSCDKCAHPKGWRLDEAVIWKA
jgi:hypothetical protein